jgi:glucose-1-phosphatase
MSELTITDEIPNPSSLKYIIFDFGNVLLDIDFQRTYEALSSILGVETSPSLAPESLKHAMLEFEVGKLSVENFLWNFQLLASGEMPQARPLIDAWNAMLIGWDPKRFVMLGRLRQKYSVCLLSNTNELHIDWVRKDLKNNHQITDFEDTMFDHVFYSHKVGMRKPNEAIYKHVINELSADPKEILFIDDLEENLTQPRAQGWNTYLHNPKDDIIEIVEKKFRLFD